MACGPADEPTCSARIQWVGGARFLLVEARGSATPPGCPPRTWLYEVVEAGPAGVVLKATWLGWGVGRDIRETYRLGPVPDSVRAGF